MDSNVQPGLRNVVTPHTSAVWLLFKKKRTVLREKATLILNVKLSGWVGDVRFPCHLCLPLAAAPTFSQLLQKSQAPAQNTFSPSLKSPVPRKFLPDPLMSPVGTPRS